METERESKEYGKGHQNRLDRHMGEGEVRTWNYCGNSLTVKARQKEGGTEVGSERQARRRDSYVGIGKKQLFPIYLHCAECCY